MKSLKITYDAHDQTGFLEKSKECQSKIQSVVYVRSIIKIGPFRSLRKSSSCLISFKAILAAASLARPRLVPWP